MKITGKEWKLEYTLCDKDFKNVEEQRCEEFIVKVGDLADKMGLTLSGEATPVNRHIKKILSIVKKDNPQQ